jgi:dsDNA-binding SOS-regulon protein
MEAKVIIVTVVKSNKSENNVWAVAFTGEEECQAYCKSAYKAMRFAFMLKKQSGCRIDDKSLKALSEEIAKLKAEAAEAAAEAEQPAEQEAQQPEAEEKPKKQRKPRKKAEPKVVSMQPIAQQELIAFQ